MSNELTVTPDAPAAIAPLSAELENVIFQTIASECKTPEERALYKMTAAAHGIDPRTKRLHATRRKSAKKDEDGNTVLEHGKPVMEAKLVFVVAFDHYKATAESRGWTITAAAVCERDVFVFDAANQKVEKHTFAMTAQGRGQVVGGWGQAVHRDGRRIAIYESLGNIAGNSPQWRTQLEHMVWKCMIARAARAAESQLLGGLYFDGEIAEDAPPAPVVRNVTPQPTPPASTVTLDATMVPGEFPPRAVIAPPPAPAARVIEAQPIPAEPENPTPPALPDEPVRPPQAIVDAAVTALVNLETLCELRALKNADGSYNYVAGALAARPTAKKALIDPAIARVRALAEGVMPPDGQLFELKWLHSLAADCKNAQGGAQ